MIGSKLGLKEDELRFAELTALYHDVGRFEQYVKYNTFADYKSENHAELGVKVLKQNNVLKSLEESSRDLVYRIISYHNRAVLPEEETDTCLFYSKLLRDADKLDIFKVVTDYYFRTDGSSNNAIELELPDYPEISDKVYEAILKKQIVESRFIRTLNDFKVLQIGWVFDINFKPTMDALISRKYIDKICSTLPDISRVKEIKGIVKQTME